MRAPVASRQHEFELARRDETRYGQRPERWKTASCHVRLVGRRSAAVRLSQLSKDRSRERFWASLRFSSPCNHSPGAGRGAGSGTTNLNRNPAEHSSTAGPKSLEACLVLLRALPHDDHAYVHRAPWIILRPTEPTERQRLEELEAQWSVVNGQSLQPRSFTHSKESPTRRTPSERCPLERVHSWTCLWLQLELRLRTRCDGEA